MRFSIGPHEYRSTCAAVSTSQTGVTVGQPLILTATINGRNAAVTGSVTFYSGSTVLGTVPVSGLTASYAASSLGSAVYSFTASYSGDASNNPSVSAPLLYDRTDPGTAPIAGLNFPADNSLGLSGNGVSIGYFATAASGNWITQVSTYDSGTLIETDSFNGSQGTVARSLLAAANTGGHDYYVIATDNFGHTGRSPTSHVDVDLNNLTPPTVSLTSPANGSTFQVGTPITLVAAAVGNNGATVNTTKFNANDVVIESIYGTSPFSAHWTPATTGNYSIVAYATDSNVNTTISAPIVITVLPSPNPTVAIVSPGNTQLAAPSGVLLAAAANASAGRTITGVSFFNGATFLGTVGTSPYQFSLASTSQGVYHITAVATDNTGASTTSAIATFESNTSDTTPGETLTFLHTDIAGSPIAATDLTGAILWREAYSPFGSRLDNQQASLTNREFFHGKPVDVESGMQYFGARFYDPTLGRFLAVDAKEFSTSDVQSFGRYSYGNDSPYAYRDPDGNQSVAINPGGSITPAPAGVGAGEALAASSRAGAFGVMLATVLSISGDSAKREEPRIYVTYERTNLATGQVYSGRTSGTGDPQSIVDRRAAGQGILNAEGFSRPTVDKASPDPRAIRGREQQLIDRHGGAASVGGKARNAINGVADFNPLRPLYMNSARDAFGSLPDNSPARARFGN